MKIRPLSSLVALTGVALLLGAGGAAALNDAEYAAVQKLANEYLTALPDRNWYEYMAEDVAKMVKEGKTDFVLVDVRVPKDKKFDVGHVPGAMCIGAPDIAKPENLRRLPKDRKVIVYCDTGQQQNKVVTVLRLLGYDAWAMKWGYMAWTTVPPTAATLDAINGAITKGYPIQK
jgi:rhodanese-related sulfurtransferase